MNGWQLIGFFFCCWIVISIPGVVAQDCSQSNLNDVIRLAGQRCNGLQPQDNCEQVCGAPLEDMYNLVESCDTTILSPEMNQVLRIIFTKFPENYCETLEPEEADCFKAGIDNPSSSCNMDRIDLLGVCMKEECTNDDDGLSSCPASSDCELRVHDFYNSIVECEDAFDTLNVNTFSAYSRARPRLQCQSECGGTFDCESRCSVDILTSSMNQVQSSCGDTDLTEIPLPPETEEQGEFNATGSIESTCTATCKEHLRQFYALLNRCVDYMQNEEQIANFFGDDMESFRRLLRQYPPMLCGPVECEITPGTREYSNRDGSMCQCPNFLELQHYYYAVSRDCPLVEPDSGSISDDSQDVQDGNSTHIPDPGATSCDEDCQFSFVHYLREFVQCFGLRVSQSYDAYFLRQILELPCIQQDSIFDCDVALRASMLNMELLCAEELPGACNEVCVDSVITARAQIEECRTLRQDPMYGSDSEQYLDNVATYCLDCQRTIEIDKTNAIEVCNEAALFANENNTVETCSEVCDSTLSTLREQMLACENPNVMPDQTTNELSLRHQIFLDGVGNTCELTTQSQATCVSQSIETTGQALQACSANICVQTCLQAKSNALSVALGCPSIVPLAETSLQMIDEVCDSDASLMFRLALVSNDVDVTTETLSDQIRAAGLIESGRLQVLLFQEEIAKRIVGDSSAVVEVYQDAQIIGDNSQDQIALRLLSSSAFINTGLDDTETTILLEMGSLENAGVCLQNNMFLLVIFMIMFSFMMHTIL